MSNTIETLLLRNLQEVFGEADAARRRAAIDKLYTEDCTLHRGLYGYSSYRPSAERR